MKKISMMLAAVAAVVFCSCSGNSTPKADLKTDADTMSYAMGVAMSEDAVNNAIHYMNMDSVYIEEFIKGLCKGLQADGDKKEEAYIAGLMMSMDMKNNVNGINRNIAGVDSVQVIDMSNFIAGLSEGAKKSALMDIDSAYTLANEMAVKVVARLSQDNKEAGEKFMKEIAAKEGVKALGDGIYYEVVKEGNGEIPADTCTVKVNYEGKLVDGTVFDSSYDRGEPATFPCNRVIPGWTKALVNMPVGSTWMVYIPQDQAYGERPAGQIRPYSCLIFKIELLGIE